VGQNFFFFGRSFRFGRSRLNRFGSRLFLTGRNLFCRKSRHGNYAGRINHTRRHGVNVGRITLLRRYRIGVRGITRLYRISVRWIARLSRYWITVGIGISGRIGGGVRTIMGVGRLMCAVIRQGFRHTATPVTPVVVVVFITVVVPARTVIILTEIALLIRGYGIMTGFLLRSGLGNNRLDEHLRLR